MVVGKGEKSIFEILAQTLLEKVSCWNDILPKRSKLSWIHYVHAIRDRERETMPRQILARKGATADKQTKYPSLSSDGRWHTDGPMVVSQYTQTKQKRLRAKTVKSGHGRHYKKKTLL